MKKTTLTFLIMSSLSLSQAQDVLIPAERSIEDFKSQDSALRGQMSITLEQGSDNILIDKRDNDVLFVQEEQKQEVEKRVNNYSIAVQTTNISSIENLLKNGYSPNQEIYEGNTLVTIAGLRNNNRMLEIAVENKANLLKTNKSGDNLLHLATAYGKPDFFMGVKKLIDNDTWKKLILQNNKLERNLLQSMLVYQNYNLDLTKILIQNGININSVDNKKQSALHYAAIYGQWDILEELIKAGGNLYLKDSEGLSVEDYILKNIPIISAYRFFSNLSPDGQKKIITVIDKITLNDKEKEIFISK